MGKKNEKKNEGEKKAADGGGGKKDDGSTTVVLKLDLHCEGCAKKVKRSVGHFEGVENVVADWESGKLTVTGKVDPSWLHERVEYKTKKKVGLVSPQSKKDGGGGGGDKKSEEKSEKKAEEKKSEDKKPKEPVVSTVDMKIKLHCDGCAHKIKRTISKNIDGELV
ncbi:heavy metal-associated isoprenylated plant protein 3-like [Olea europaea var. sylvestris]|uniref:heavy metal-associated isoprenylated plant protein 3-like n=1 Tax=Olea europaea var. sylvestris TaxID=158386 RepID=UPI000C1CF91F|nr:heavy metal-associated isoprenylated plant protein 3-like [Olea europaea var. sylvestris]